jgi:hypothetical protein
MAQVSLTEDPQTQTELEPEFPTKGDVFEVLSNERRRYVLRAIRESESSLDLGSLSEQVAAWENDIPRKQVKYNQRKNVYTALQQSHLPKMDEAGAIDFEENRGIIRGDEHIDSFDYYLTVVPSGTFVYSHYYLFAGIMSSFLGVLVGTGILPVPIVPDLAIAGLVIGVFGTLTVFHMIHRIRANWELTNEEAT